MLKKPSIVTICLLVVLVIGGFALAPSLIEKSMNKPVDMSDYKVSEEAQTLHRSLMITD